MKKTTEALKLAGLVEASVEECMGDDGMVAVIPLDLYNDLMTAIREALAEPVKQEPVAFNIAAQCRATASDAIAANIIVDAGSGTLRELLLDAAQALENAAPVDAKAIRAEECERICAAIKAEDDYCIDNGDYMLDSNDCIKVARGEWVRPDFDLTKEKNK